MSQMLKKTFVTALCVSTLSVGLMATEGTSYACKGKKCSTNRHHKKKCNCKSKDCNGKCHESGAAKKDAAVGGDQHPEGGNAAPSKTE